MRHRYVAFEVGSVSTDRDGKSAIARAILNKIKERSNMAQQGRFEFRVIDYDSSKSRGIIKVIPHSAIEEIKKLVLSINEINNHPTELRILGVSGTIKSLRGKYMSDRVRFRPKVINPAD